MSKTLRIAVQLLVVMIPVAFVAESFLQIAYPMTMQRILRTLCRTLSPIPFMLGSILLGLIVRASYRWFSSPNRYTFVNMLVTTACLGTILLYGLHLSLFFHMPGDGPIPD